jgi:hypothetical protein
MDGVRLEQRAFILLLFALDGDMRPLLLFPLLFALLVPDRWRVLGVLGSSKLSRRSIHQVRTKDTFEILA